MGLYLERVILGGGGAYIPRGVCVSQLRACIGVGGGLMLIFGGLRYVGNYIC